MGWIPARAFLLRVDRTSRPGRYRSLVLYECGLGSGAHLVRKSKRILSFHGHCLRTLGGNRPCCVHGDTSSSRRRRYIQRYNCRNFDLFYLRGSADLPIADWSGLSIEFDWSDLGGKTISTDEAIKAARIRNEEGGVFELVVEDEDAVDDDLAGRVEIKLDELKVGKNKRKLSKSTTNAVRRINVQVLPQGSSLKDLVELMR